MHPFFFIQTSPVAPMLRYSSSNCQNRTEQKRLLACLHYITKKRFKAISYLIPKHTLKKHKQDIFLYLQKHPSIIIPPIRIVHRIRHPLITRHSRSRHDDLLLTLIPVRFTPRQFCHDRTRTASVPRAFALLLEDVAVGVLGLWLSCCIGVISGQADCPGFFLRTDVVIGLGGAGFGGEGAEVCGGVLQGLG